LKKKAARQEKEAAKKRKAPEDGEGDKADGDDKRDVPEIPKGVFVKLTGLNAECSREARYPRRPISHTG